MYSVTVIYMWYPNYKMSLPKGFMAFFFIGDLSSNENQKVK